MTQEPLTPDNIPRMRDCGLKTLDELAEAHRAKRSP